MSPEPGLFAAVATGQLPVATSWPTQLLASVTAPSPGPVEQLVSLLTLGFVPAVAAAFACWALYVYRKTISEVDRSTAILGCTGLVLLGGALAADFLLGGTLADATQSNARPAADLLAGTVAVVVLLAMHRVVSDHGPGVALGAVLLALGVGWIVAVVATGEVIEGGALDDVALLRLVLSAVLPLSYAYGRALGHLVRTGDRRWALVTGGLIVATAPLALAPMIPLAGGPAPLVVPVIAGYHLVALTAAVPLVALGAGDRAGGDGPSARPDSATVIE